MAAHPDPDALASADLSPASARAIAAAFATLPAAAILSAALWAVAASCTTSAGLSWTGALIFAGLYPFSLSIQQWRGTWLEPRMKLGRFGVVTLSFALILLFGPGPVFMGASCTTGPTVLQSGLMVLSLGWITWAGLRCVDTGSPAR
ncbi:MAG: hypothetical protein AAFY38_00710 [Pseudomonadota bacterium]